jgi:cell division protease FtsH
MIPKPKKNLTPQRPSRKLQERFRFNWWIIYLIIFGLLFFLPYITSTPSQEINWQFFEQNLLRTKKVEKLMVINNERVDVYLKTKAANEPTFKDISKISSNKNPTYSFGIGSIESFERKIEEAEKGFPLKDRIPVTYVKYTNWFWNSLGWLIPLVILILFWGYLIRKSSGMTSDGNSIFNFGKSTATLIEKKKSDFTFKDVAGLAEAKVEVMEIVSFLKKPTDFTRLGAKIPKGMVLVGPPGTGKTLLAKAVAGEAQVPFFTLSGSEFVEMFVGVGASRVRDLFKRAKEKAPCIIFIDEIDAIGRSRGKGTFLSGANDERESTLNQLLTEMDGFGTNSGVIVLAATNRADLLDPALLRPGRFDRHIYLELPNKKEREEIFAVHLKPLVTDGKVDVDFLAGQTPGFSGADIANICNEAALIAARKKEDEVNKSDFLEAIDRVVAGLEKRSKIISPEEKKIIAYHEAGHAVVSWMLKNIDPLVKVSIIPRGKSLGSAWYLPEEKQLRSKAAFMDSLCAALGGRAAEELIFHETTSGALDDLEKVTKEAYMMVSYYGFNQKLGNISYYDSTGQRDAGLLKPYSEETGKLIDEEVRKLIAEVYEKSKSLLQEHKENLTQVAELLLKKEIIFKEDLLRILGQRPDYSTASHKRKAEAVLT